MSWVCLVVAALLAGCTGVSLNTPKPGAAPAPTPVAAAAARQIDGGVVIEYAGHSTELPAQAAALLGWVAQETSGDRRWEIKGYSDKLTDQNAREIALTRALAVRKELVDRGVPAHSLKVLYSTESPREAVTILPR